MVVMMLMMMVMVLVGVAAAMAGQHTDLGEGQIWDGELVERARELTTRDSVMAEVASQACRHLKEHRESTGFDGLHESMLGKMYGFGIGQALNERLGRRS